MFKPLIDSFNYFKCNQNYKKKLEELRAKKDGNPIRVCFLVRENQKWSYQSLYELLDKSEDFEPIVLVSLLWLSHIGKDPTRNNLVKNYNFFKERGMNVQYVYENGEYLDLRNFKPDIVFYDQQWDLPKIHQPTSVSKFALTCYVPYGFSIGHYNKDYTQDFHKLLFRIFLEHEYTKKRYEKINKDNSKNCIVTGLLKFDEYNKPRLPLTNLWKEPEKFKIVYAPHHSLENNGLRFATFRQNGKFILKYAQKHPNTTWVFKPHPRFKYALLRNNIMTEAEIEKYYSDWGSVGKIHSTGNYFEIFKTSDLLLTDSCSFLAEYMPSEKPIIQIINKNRIKLSDIGNILSSGTYEVFENNEIEKTLNLLINKNEDKKYNLRKKISSQIFDKTKSHGQKVFEEIIRILNKMEETWQT